MGSILIFLLFLPISGLTFALPNWFPVEVEVALDPNNIEGDTHTASYSPLINADKKWNLCASFPHLKDDYWLAVNFGIVDEARRQGVSIDLFIAGGYTQLEQQINQIRNCVKMGLTP